MRKEIIQTGKTVDAAIDAACLGLGCQREDCEWEIIDLPKKGFLGIKNLPAKVRVSIEIPDIKPVDKPAFKQQSQPVQTQAARPQQVQTPTPRPQQTQTAPRPQQSQSGSQPVPRPQQSQPRPQPSFKPESSPEQRPVRQPKPVGEVVPDLEKEAIIRAYVGDILNGMGLTAEQNITYEEGGMCLNITGQGLGVIIGRRGETLDALQYLASLVANRSDGDYMRVTIDCGDYRVKRQQTLESLARKLAAQVIKTNTSKTLEPMNPFERRIIHATVSEIEGVSSISIGEEPNRRVVITSPAARSRGPRPPVERGGYRPNQDRGPRRDRNDDSEQRTGVRDNAERSYERRDNRDRGRPPRRERPAPQQAPAVPKQTPEASESGSLYAKIDLE